MSLRSILNVGSSVELRGRKVPINGITVQHLAHLVTDHWDTLNALLQHQRSDLEVVCQKSPDFVAAVIAYGTGASEKEFEEECKFAKTLSFSDQFTLLTAIWDETVPDPDALKKLLGRLEGMLVGPVGSQA